MHNYDDRSIGGPDDLGHEPVRVPVEALRQFTTTFFEELGLSRNDAEGAAEILVASDLRGIESHGVPRLPMYRGLFQTGRAKPDAPFTIVRETGATALVDAGNGLGLVQARRAMQLAIDKAAVSGVGLVAVTNSTHFGIAGFYAEMAVPHDMIGLAFTNGTPIGVPTYGRDPRLGSNPIAFAAPAGEERPFLLDMATTTVSMGKVEIAARLEKQVPEGWGLDPEGNPTSDPHVILGGRRITPLGSFPELASYKGYGLAVMVDILTGVLSGMGYSFKVPRLLAGHFFGALRIDAFRNVGEFKQEMDEMIRDLRATPPSGENRVYVAGEKEYLAEAENLKLGVPLHPRVLYHLRLLSREMNIPWMEEN